MNKYFMMNAHCSMFYISCQIFCLLVPAEHQEYKNGVAAALVVAATVLRLTFAAYPSPHAERGTVHFESKDDGLFQSSKQLSVLPSEEASLILNVVGGVSDTMVKQRLRIY